MPSFPRILVPALAAAAPLWSSFAHAQGGSATGLDLPAIESYITAQMEAERIPGLAIAIVHGGAVVYSRGFGVDGTGTPVTPETSFVLGSMSKAFTALAVMQLVEEGRVDLDQPARTYLPWFTLSDPVDSARITVRHLLHHTSGLPTRAPRGSDEARSIRQQVEALGTARLKHEPGTRHEYSSPNYLVLGAIVEAVSDLPYEAFVQLRILDPLQMRQTFVEQESAIRNGMSRGHRYWFGFPVSVKLRHEAERLPTAAIIGSAGDLGRFMIAQLNGGQYGGQSLISPEGMAIMHRPGIVSEGFSYGMGWRINAGPTGSHVVHHGGIVPHFRGKMVMVPEERWGVAVLTNVSSALPFQPASHRIADDLGAYLAGAPLPQPGSRMKSMYAAIIAIILVVTASQGKRTVRVWRELRGTSAAGQPRGPVFEVLGLVLPVALLFGLPKVTGIPWSEAVRSAPDLAYWLLIVASIDLAVGLVSVVRVARSHSIPARR